MTKRSRKTREELRRAILRIEHQRPKRVAKEACRLTISMVAREAGLTPASIYNSYPDIAELIRAKRRTPNEVGPATAESKVRKLSAQVSRLQEQRRNAEKDVARLASENARFLSEIAELRARLRCHNVVELAVPKKRASL